MIKLKTLNGEMPFASIDDLKHDALVAHAYQQALRAAHVGGSYVPWVEERAIELLKSWGVEND